MTERREFRLLTALGEIDDAYIAEAAPSRRIPWRRFTALAACLCLVVTVTLTMRLHTDLDPTLAPITLSERSQGVSVRHVAGNIRAPQSEACLVGLTLEEIFTPETTIVRGRVSGIENIELSFNGQREYRAIATVAVDESIQGDVQSGDSIRILLPCPITGDVRMSATAVTAAMRTGMEGIFMPCAYDADAYWEQNGATLYLAEVAPYGLWDGLRWVFLAGDDGLIFERGVYEAVADAGSLDEIEAFIRAQIDERGVFVGSADDPGERIDTYVERGTFVDQP